jgi:hypothetical protein
MCLNDPMKKTWTRQPFEVDLSRVEINNDLFIIPDRVETPQQINLYLNDSRR